MGYEPSGPFVTSVIESKLDQMTMFEWQRHSPEANQIPFYQELLDFLELRANVSENRISKVERKNPPTAFDKRTW